MIRIRTRFPVMGTESLRVLTLFSNGKWVTMTTGLQTKEAESLMDAGLNHLEMACTLRKKLNV